MQQTPAGTITEHFTDLDDPRRYNRRHLLLDMVVIAICAVICGADDWPEAMGRPSAGSAKSSAMLG